MEGEADIKLVIERPDSPSESLWAKRIDDKTAELRNNPFDSDYSLFDTVSYEERNGRKYVTGLVKRTLKNVGVCYIDKSQEHSMDELKEMWKKLVDLCIKNDLRIEGITPGYASICYPVEMPDERLSELLNRKDSPVKCYIYFEETETDN